MGTFYEENLLESFFSVTFSLELCFLISIMFSAVMPGFMLFPRKSNPSEKEPPKNIYTNLQIR